MNKTVMLWKAYSQGSKRILAFFLAISITVFLLVSSLSVIKANETITVRNLLETYGNFSVSSEDENALSQKEQLAADPRIESVLPIGFFQAQLGKDHFQIIYASDQVSDFYNFKLVDGTFPKNENEVAIEKSYLFQQGLSESEMLGATISVPSSDGTEEQAIVTGVLQVNKSISGFLDEIVILRSNQESMYTRLLIQIKDLEHYKSVLDSINEDYHLNKKKCYVNYDLFTALGITVGSNILESNTAYYRVIFFVLLLCSALTVYNLVKLLIKKLSEEISIMNLLGISSRSISLSLVELLGLVTVFGILLGLVLGFGVAIPATEFFLSARLPLSDLYKTFQYGRLGISIGILFGTALLVITPEILRLTKCSPNEFLRKNTITPDAKKRPSLFEKKPIFWHWTLASRNIRSERFLSVISMLTVFASILAVTLAVYSIQMNKQSFLDETDYDYKVTFETFDLDNMDGVQEKKLYDSWTADPDMQVFPNYSTTSSISFPVDWLSEKHKEYLEDQEQVYVYDQLISVSVPILILGYNDNQLAELADRNHLKQLSLSDDECIVLEKTVPFRGTEGFDIGWQVGETLKVPSYFEDTDSEYTIQTKVKDLAINSTGVYNRPCVIITEKAFQKLWQADYPDSLYVNTTKEEAFIGYDCCTLEIPSEEKELFDTTNVTLTRVLSLLLSSIFASALLALASSFYLNLESRKGDFVLLNCMGIRKKDIMLIFLIERLREFVLGFALTLAPIYVLTLYIMQVLLDTRSTALYEYPVTIVLCDALALLILIAFGSVLVSKKFLKEDMVSYLKEQL